MIPELERVTGKTFPPSDQLHTDETNKFFRELLTELNLECAPVSPQGSSHALGIES